MSKDAVKIGPSPDDVKQQALDFHQRLQAFIAPLIQDWMLHWIAVWWAPSWLC